VDPFLGQINLFAGNFAPRGWAFCDGQLIAISRYSALFSLLGTIYGGDGRTTFALPDLRGRAPVHMGSGPGLSAYREGQKGGAESVTLGVAQLPAHHHGVEVQHVDNTSLGAEVAGGIADDPTQITATHTTANTGGGQPHENRQPHLAINYIIALQGIFPPRS